MNKQIEEMAKAIFETGEAIEEIDLRCACLHGADSDSETKFMRIARHLYRSGYRKANDVAREIFAEIAKFIFSEIPNELTPIYKKELNYRDGVISGKREAFFEVLNHLDKELRKKYEREGADDA